MIDYKYISSLFIIFMQILNAIHRWLSITENILVLVPICRKFCTIIQSDVFYKQNLKKITYYKQNTIRTMMIQILKCAKFLIVITIFNTL